MLMKTSLNPFILQKKRKKKKTFCVSVRLHSECLKLSDTQPLRNLCSCQWKKTQCLPQNTTEWFTWVLSLVWTSNIPLQYSKDEIAEYRYIVYCVLLSFIVLSCKVFVMWLQFWLVGLTTNIWGKPFCKIGKAETELCVSSAATALN